MMNVLMHPMFLLVLGWVTLLGGVFDGAAGWVALLVGGEPPEHRVAPQLAAGVALLVLSRTLRSRRGA